MRGFWAVSLAAVFAIAASAAAQAYPACDGLVPATRESYPEFRARARRSQCVKPWTVLVYMAADNDLAPYAFWDLHEMEAGYASGRPAAGSTRRSDLLVQLTAPGTEDIRRIHVFQQIEPYSHRLKLEDFGARGIEGVQSPTAGIVPRTASANVAEDFKRFLEWGIREYPAEHYMIVVWGHGQGWAPAAEIEGAARKSMRAGDFAGRRFGGLAFSDSQKSFLDIPSLHRALKQVSSDSLGGRPIDVYASDACLMQMIEVANEISDSARFVVGSSEVENYLGLPYRRMMFEINTGRFAGERAARAVGGSANRHAEGSEHDEPFLLARAIPRLFRASLDPKRGLHGRPQPQAVRTVTMSAISSDELRGELLPVLRELARRLRAYLIEDPDRAIAVVKAMRAAPSFMGGSQDLGGFLTLLGQAVASELGSTATTAALAHASAAARSALDRTVLSYALGTRYSEPSERLYLLGTRATALWLPTSRADYASRIADFAASAFYRELGEDWSEALRLVFE